MTNYVMVVLGGPAMNCLSNSCCQVVNQPFEVAVVNGQTLAWCSLIASSILAGLALLGFLIPIICKLRRKVTIDIPDEKFYWYPEREDVSTGDSDSIDEGNSLFMIPIKNTGNTRVGKLEIKMDCVLKMCNDGRSYEKLYCGLPKKFRGQSLELTEDVLIDETVYVRFVKFVHDINANSTGSGGAGRVLVKCGLAVDGANGVADGFYELSSDGGTFLIHLLCRGENMNKEYSRWMFLHWTAPEINQNNLTISLATQEQVSQADEMFGKIKTEGR